MIARVLAVIVLGVVLAYVQVALSQAAPDSERLIIIERMSRPGGDLDEADRTILGSWLSKKLGYPVTVVQGRRLVEETGHVRFDVWIQEAKGGVGYPLMIHLGGPEAPEETRK